MAASNRVRCKGQSPEEVFANHVSPFFWLRGFGLEIPKIEKGKRKDQFMRNCCLSSYGLRKKLAWSPELKSVSPLMLTAKFLFRLVEKGNPLYPPYRSRQVQH